MHSVSVRIVYLYYIGDTEATLALKSSREVLFQLFVYDEILVLWHYDFFLASNLAFVAAYPSQSRLCVVQSNS